MLSARDGVGPESGAVSQPTALTFVDCRPDLFRPDFHEWLSNIENYRIFEAFEREANKVWDSGRPHYSARTIVEYLRHHTMLQERSTGLAFKLNGNYAPDLARLYVCYHPERAEFFEFRSGCSAVRAA